MSNKWTIQGNWQQDEEKEKTTEHYYTQTHRNSINNTRAHLQTTGGKDEPTIFLCTYRNGLHTELRT